MKRILNQSTPVLIGLAIFVIFTSVACGLSIPKTEGMGEAPTISHTQVIPTPAVISLPEAVTDEQGVLISLYALVNPSVVNITIYGSQGGQVTAISQGSGFVYDGDGHIITNAHVVEGADQVDVTFSEGTTRLAKVVGTDLHADLAVIRIDDMPPGIAPLPLGDINDVLVGQTVVAIGNPFGLQGTLTKGIVSALGRNIPALTAFSIPQSIQTDAAINPGNSGGPLLDLQGKVVGVNAQIETSSLYQTNSGVGFAIPVSIVKLVVPDLIEKGEHEWAWLGVRGSNLSATVVQAMNLTIDKGAYIAEITEGGPAEKADMRGASGIKTVDGRAVDVGGDIVTAINGSPVHSFDDLLIYIAMETRPGDEVILEIMRDGKLIEVRVTLEKRPGYLSE
ncbi:MAG: trypsin-like peptidase domain-containing protein [Anaerolineales bacterium]|nr:trypsin-like peptidase domain-containing protein [Anaerolineales bacterium]